MNEGGERTWPEQIKTYGSSANDSTQFSRDRTGRVNVCAICHIGRPQHDRILNKADNDSVCAELQIYKICDLLEISLESPYLLYFILLFFNNITKTTPLFNYPL